MELLTLLISILFSIAIVALIISVHEGAHAYAAHLLGDNTAKLSGRMTLNPLAHIDLFGTLLLPLILILFHLPVFGWAKPTPFNPFNLQNPRRDSALIAVSGPVSNLIVALAVAAVSRLAFGNNPAGMFQSDAFVTFIFPIVLFNVTLAVFNLIPVEPLDGFKVVGGLLPAELASFWYSLAPYGPIILFVLLFTPGTAIIGNIISPLTKTILSLLLGFPPNIL